MKKLILAGVVVLLGGVAFAMSDVYVSGIWRYKMTVTVETPEGLKTGYAVREVSNSASDIKIIDLPESGNPAKVRGEAVAVDLGERGVLFALISDAFIFHRAFRGDVSGSTTVRGIKFFNDIPIGTKVTLNEKFYPKLVTFTDIDDPKSVGLVRGSRFDIETQKSFPVNDFEKLFGVGVQLKKITIERVKEPVTWQVSNYLKWLPDYYNKRLDGNRFGTIRAKDRLANSLSSGAFSTGSNKK